METSVERKSRIERTNKLLNDPAGTMDVIFADVANGGSLIDLCHLWDVRYSDIINWIDKDHERRRRYESALSANSEWAIQRVLKEVRSLAFIDIRKIFHENGALKDIKDWPEEAARAIAGVDVFEEHEGTGKERTFIGYTKKVKLADKLKALEFLGKNLHMLVDRVEHSGKVTLEELVAGSQKGGGTDGQETKA